MSPCSIASATCPAWKAPRWSPRRRLSGMDVGTSFDIVGQPEDPGDKPQARVTAVSGDYARTFGTPIVRGRMVTDSDTAGDAVCGRCQRRRWPKSTLPAPTRSASRSTWAARKRACSSPTPSSAFSATRWMSSVGGDVQPLILIPQQQIPTTSLFYQALLKTVVSFVVKTRGDIPVAAEMRSVFHQDAPGFALDNFQTMQEAVDQNTFSQRLGLYLVGSFAGLAVAMVIAGLYGVLSQLVSYRRREIGVRMALGATRISVAQLVLRQGSDADRRGAGRRPCCWHSPPAG